MPKKKSTGGDTSLRRVSLGEKNSELKKEEVMCPICWSLLIEPVALPCTHHLCLQCFKSHVAQTSLQCPCCRIRLSVWSRRAFRENNLVDKLLWSRIQNEFPEIVRARMNGEDSQFFTSSFLSPPSISKSSREKDSDSHVVGNNNGISGNSAASSTVSSVTAADLLSDSDEDADRTLPRDIILTSRPGELRQELEKVLHQHHSDLEKEHRLEEEQSQNLIKQIQEEEEAQQSIMESQSEQDFLFAKKLAEELEERNLTPTSGKRKLSLSGSENSPSKTSSPHKTHGPESSSADSSRSKSFKSLCFNSSAMPSKFSKSVSTPKTSSRRSSKPKSRILQNLSSQRNLSREARRGSILSFLSQQPTSPEDNSLAFTGPDDQSSLFQDSQAFFSEEFFPSSSKHHTCPKSETITKASDDNIEEPSTSEKLRVDDSDSQEISDKSSSSAFCLFKPQSNKSTDFDTEKTTVRASTTATATSSIPANEECDEREIPTPDSIDMEVNRHFKPIATAPKTPPKRIAGGAFAPEPLLVKLTPRKPSPGNVGPDVEPIIGVSSVNVVDEQSGALEKSVSYSSMDQTKGMSEREGVSATDKDCWENSEDNLLEVGGYVEKDGHVGGEKSVASFVLPTDDKDLGSSQQSDTSSTTLTYDDKEVPCSSNSIFNYSDKGDGSAAAAFCFTSCSQSAVSSTMALTEQDIRAQVEALKRIEREKARMEEDMRLAKQLHRELNKSPSEQKGSRESPYCLRSWLQKPKLKRRSGSARRSSRNVSISQGKKPAESTSRT